MSTAVAKYPIKVCKTYGCWLWLGHLDRDGYPREKGKLAHRLVYSNEVGLIPSGRELDHVCRNRSCVRPEHLNPVTRSENERAKSWRRRSKRHRCDAGHDLFTHGRRTPHGGKVCLKCTGMR